MKKIFVSVILTCLGLFVHNSHAQSQDAMAEMQKIKIFYSNDDLKHVTGHMFLKETNTGKEVDKVDFEYWLKGKQIFTKMKYIEILNNNAVYIMVNHNNKSIFARKLKDLKQKPAPGFFDAEQLKNLLSTKDAKVTMVREKSNVKISLSGLSNSRFSTVDITSSSEGRIEKIEAAIKQTGADDEKLRLEIIYNPVKTEKSVVNPAVFSETKYLEAKKKGHYTYTSAYQNYTKL